MLDKKHIHNIIRVDHAGEYGAKRIYEGQIDFIKNPAMKVQIKEMLEHELEHLEYFENKIKTDHIRPTILLPFWHVAGYSLGAVTALLGDKMAMACTAAVETVIESHYQKQLDELAEGELKNSITKFQADEAHHKEIAIEEKALEAPLYGVFAKLIKTGSKTAIWLSERF